MTFPSPNRLPDAPDDLPPWLGRWFTIICVTGVCALFVCGEAQLVTDRLMVGIFVLILLVVGATLLVVVLIHAARKRTAWGAAISLGIVIVTLLLVLTELPSTLLNAWRLHTFKGPATEVLLAIRKQNRDYRLTGMPPKQELNRFRPNKLPWSISNARVFVERWEWAPSCSATGQQCVRFSLVIDSIECELDVYSDLVTCRPLKRFSN